MQKPIVELLFEKAYHYADVNSSIVKWAESMGVHLYSNQVEILKAVCDPTGPNVTILAARSSGKTYSVALAAVRLCIENSNFGVIIFSPKAAQSTRVIDQIVQICNSCRDTLYKEVDWNHSNKAQLNFFNGSRITGLGAAEGSQQEGHHCDMIITDESHQISDVFYAQRISPMVKSSAFGRGGGKVCKIGISLYANNFRESCLNPAWQHLVFPWNKCPNLFKGGTVTVDGVEYPISVLKDMPLSYKKQRFPNNPELHYPSENNLSEEDFDTQYEMKWVDSVNKFLTENDLESMIGEHDYLSHGRDGEEYFFGLDLAGGLLINQGIKRDYSSLAIVRKNKDGVVELVAGYEYQGDVVEQMQDIISVIHPENGVFKCIFGTADYGSLGPAVVDMLMHAGIPIAGIRYRSSEPTTGMQYKMAIFDHIFNSIRADTFKYPKREDMAKIYILKKHFEEWADLERTANPNGTIKIAAPNDGISHDDAVNATALAVWAADKMKEELRRIQRRGMLQNLLTPNISAATTANRFNRNNLHMPAGLGKMLGNGGWRKQ